MSDVQTEPFMRPAQGHQAADQRFPAPPKLHWSLLVLFTVMTFGIFLLVWMFIQSSWARKVDPGSQATAFFAGEMFLYMLSLVFAASSSSALKSLELPLLLGSCIPFYAGVYSIRRTMLDHYNKVEAIPLEISGAMTFFFGLLHLQYHMTRMAYAKTDGK
ncbi:MAG: hypothetical protein Q7T13_18110 [Polaromonas sp.]|nr:hypothetical protein [Polaromonas sp.]